MYSALITLEGVLKNDRDAPIGEGRMLLETMKLAHIRMTMLTSGTMARAEHWLKVNQVDVDDVISKEVLVDPAENLRHRQIQVARARGQVSMVIDPDPEVIAWTLGEGLVGLLFVHPAIMLPKDRPTGVRRPWAAIQDELDRQAGITITYGEGDDGEGDYVPMEGDE
jgi:hypothetical protein